MKTISKKKTSKQREDDSWSDPALEKIFAEAVQQDERRVGRTVRWMEVECPYCSETFEVQVDPGEEGQEMIQDCQVCCKPVQLSVEVEEGEVTVFAYRS